MLKTCICSLKQLSKVYCRNMSTVIDNQLEKSVGIEVYANSSVGFVGVIKQRYTDFIVREVDYSGNTAVLEGIDGKALQQSAFETVKVETADSEEGIDLYISELLAMNIKFDEMTLRPFLISCVQQEDVTATEYVAFDGLSKELRTVVHKGIKKYFPGTADTESVQKDGVTYISIRLKKHGDKRSGFHRSNYSWPTNVGDYLKFTLLKENIDTMNAINTIAKVLRIKPTKIAYAGTKDKRAVTVQWCTVYRKRPMELMALNRNNSFPTIRVGDFQFVQEEIKLGQLAGNRFEIILRDLSVDTKQALDACEQLSKSGFINYYGLQRFGRGGTQSHVTGQQILKGEWKVVLDMTMAPRLGDKSARFQQEYMKGDYEEAFKSVPENYFIERSILEGLRRNSTDLLGAYQRAPKHSRLICLHAYQSYIWNLVASERIKKHGLKCTEGDLYVLGDLIAIDAHDDEDYSDNSFQKISHTADIKVATAENAPHIDMRNVLLPLPGYDITLPSNDIGELYISLLERDGLTMASFGNNGCHEYNSAGAYRRVIQTPLNFEYDVITYYDCNSDLADSELSKFKGPRTSYEAPIAETTLVSAGAEGTFRALKLKFTLPPGTYATMLLRELTKASTDSGFQSSLTDASRAGVRKAEAFASCDPGGNDDVESSTHKKLKNAS